MPLAAEIGVQTIMIAGARHMIRIRGQRIRQPSTTNVDPCSFSREYGVIQHIYSQLSGQ